MNREKYMEMTRTPWKIVKLWLLCECVYGRRQREKAKKSKKCKFTILGWIFVLVLFFCCFTFARLKQSTMFEAVKQIYATRKKYDVKNMILYFIQYTYGEKKSFFAFSCMVLLVVVFPWRKLPNACMANEKCITFEWLSFLGLFDMVGCGVCMHMSQNYFCYLFDTRSVLLKTSKLRHYIDRQWSEKEFGDKNRSHNNHPNSKWSPGNASSYSVECVFLSIFSYIKQELFHKKNLSKNVASFGTKTHQVS